MVCCITDVFSGNLYFAILLLNIIIGFMILQYTAAALGIYIYI